MWEAPPSGGVEPSHESQDKYTTFYLQFQRFFNESHALADYIPNLKRVPSGRGIVSKIGKGRNLTCILTIFWL